MSKNIFTAYNGLKSDLEKITEDYVFEAKQIIKHITGYTNREILERYSDTLTPVQENKLTAILNQRRIHYPLQYILGKWDFMGLPFKVGPGVLIPRPDTETLVEKTLELIKDKKEPKVLDLCCGSGCIAISIAKERPDAKVYAVEKYSVALKYAKENAILNDTKNVTFIEGDVLEGVANSEKYDLILSNPPYLDTEEMKKLPVEVTYEPETALIGGEDGMLFYREIIKNYKGSLNEGGIMAFEIGATSRQKELPDMMEKAGLINVQTATDIENRERVVFGTVKNI
ncbi:MAG: peptide chain release factor N(5)-glutamine methyltransferase [Clostridia bacterium]|nr:peptide chain release factor N(5)-glutamine methyltransferase [Clostridia bacterium]